MKRIILIAVLVLSAVPVKAADKWTRVQSKNFTLAGTATEGQIRGIAEDLEVFRTAYAKFFPLKEGSSIATTVIVFRTDDSFKPYKPLERGRPATAAGFFLGGEDMNYIALSADGETPRVIYHEMMHRLLSDNMGSLPAWFQEGFAECFSSIKIIGNDKKVQLGQALAEHVTLLNERDLMPLEQLFAVGPDSPEYYEAARQGMFYAESWALVHYMMFNATERRDQFMLFLKALSEGVPHAQAFQQVFLTDLATFQKSLEAYIQQRPAWNAFELTTAGGLDRSKSMMVRTLSEAESEYYLGDLLLHSDRLPEAETHLAKALKLDAVLGGASASMGRLLMKNTRDGEVLVYFKHATEQEPDNYLTHYYYAALLDSIGRRSGPLSEESWQTMRTELQKTIQLAPQFIEASTMLARNNLSRNVNIPETVELLVNAYKAKPGDDSIGLFLAHALARTQQRDLALPLLRNLVAKSSLNAALRQNARLLLANLDPTAKSAGPPPTVSADVSADEPLALKREEMPAPPPTAPPPARKLTQADRDRIELQLNPLSPGTARVRGLVTQLECKNGMTIFLAVDGQGDGKPVKFHTNKPEDLKFTSASAAVSGEISCGPTPGKGVPALIHYRTQTSADSIGEPISIEFLTSTGGISLTSSGDKLPAIGGASTVKGQLTKLECEVAVTIEVAADGKVLQFADVPIGEIAILNGPNADGTVSCGTITAPGLPVTVLYIPSTSDDKVGTPSVIQFQK